MPTEFIQMATTEIVQLVHYDPSVPMIHLAMGSGVVPSGADLVSALNGQLGSSIWQGGPGVPATHTHVQNPAAAIWEITHNLSVQYVDVISFDGNGLRFIGTIDYVNANLLRITSAAPIDGTAIIKV